MDALFRQFASRNAVLQTSPGELADRMLFVMEGDSLSRGNFANAAYQHYGPDEEVVKAYLTAWSELVRGGYLIEKLDPGWFFLSPSGTERKTRLKRGGVRVADSRRVVGDRWIVVEELSAGGQGVTSLVVDRDGSPEERYVLKELKSKDAQARQRFAAETRALSSLDHPNILRIIAFDVEATTPWYVSEYCAGHGLDKVSLTSLSLDTRLRLFLDVCSGLGAAHSKGITHRDLKPENVLLKSSNGPAVLGDFGICWFAEAEEERLTRANEDIGSSFCRAPELFDGPLENVSPASDVYCLGKLLYWIVIGKGGKAGRLRTEEFERGDKNVVYVLSDTRFDHINIVLRRMIAEDPQARFRDANEVYEACRTAFDLILNNYQPLSRPPNRCSYCGQGTYTLNPGGSGTSTESSLLQLWRVYQCNECGHTLFFRKNSVNSSWPLSSA